LRSTQLLLQMAM